MTGPRRIVLLLIAVATGIGIAESFSRSGLVITRPTSRTSPPPRRRTTPYVATTNSRPSRINALRLRVVPSRPTGSNWEDDTKSSRTNPDVTDFVPPWRDHQQPRATTTSSSSGSRATPGREIPLSKFAGANDDVIPSTDGGSSSSSGGTGTNPLLRDIRWPLTRDPASVGPEYPLSYARALITILSTVATWHLHVHNGHSPVLASSSMALLVSTCLDRRLGQAAMCGSFAGMSGSHLVPNYAVAVALGTVTSIAYEALIRAREVCLGIGGRLGATAFLATYAVSKYRGIGGVVTRRAGRRGLRRVAGGGAGAMGAMGSGGGPFGIFGDPILASMLIYHVLGAVVTIFLREAGDDAAAADPVRASSVVGLLGSLFLKSDPTAMLALYGGSFVGMSLPSRLMHGNIASARKDATSVIRPQTPLSLFGSFAGAGAMAGLFHALTIRHGYWNGGWGGKAGLCAFAGCWAYRGFGNAVDFLRNKRK